MASLSAPSLERMVVQWDVGGEEFVLDEHLHVERVLGSGAYGVVCEVTDEVSHNKYAVKKCKNIFSSRSVAVRTLREVRILRLLSHDKIIKMEAVLPPDDPHFFTNLYIVFEVMEADLSRIIRSSQTLTDSHLQYFMIQILSGLAYMHASHVIHRDLKPKNLLINGNCIIKIADFGLAKCFGDDSTGTTAPMTDYVTTRWYRAPEILGGWTNYSSAVDLWSVGTIFAELLGRVPMFPGKSSTDQLDLIIAVLGRPDSKFFSNCRSHKAINAIKGTSNSDRLSWMTVFPTASTEALEFLDSFLRFNPDERKSAKMATEHRYLSSMIKEVENVNYPPRLDLMAEFTVETGRPTLGALRNELLKEVKYSSTKSLVTGYRKAITSQNATTSVESTYGLPPRSPYITSPPPKMDTELRPGVHRSIASTTHDSSKTASATWSAVDSTLAPHPSKSPQAEPFKCHLS